MALARTNRHQQSFAGGHGTGVATTSSFTPVNNSLLVVAVWGIESTDGGMRGTDLTITDSAGLTWTSRAATTASPSWSYGTRVWTAPVTTGVSMTVSVDCGASNIVAYRVEIYEYTGHDVASPIGATQIGSDADGDGAASITLSGTPATTSEVIAFANVSQGNLGTSTVTHGTGWTELFDVLVEDGWMNSQTQIRSGSTSTTVSWDDLHVGTAPNFGACMAAIEVKEATAGGSSILRQMLAHH